MSSWRVPFLQILLSLFLASLLTPILFVSHALAGLNPITITSQNATETFPKGVDFQVNVSDSAGSITEATLTLAIDAPNYFHVVRQVTVGTPASTLSLQWHEDTSTSDSFLNPGTTLSYNWGFFDKSTQQYFYFPRQTLTVIDTRFSWQHISQGQVQVEWYNQPSNFGQAVLTQAVSNIKRISGNLGGTLLHPITLWVYQSPEDFRGSLPPGVHEWVGGIAFPSLEEASIVVDSLNATTLIRDMPHELTHLVFHQLTAQGILAPLWFDEGLAVYNQDYREPDMLNTFDHALSTHTLLRLNEISYTFPDNADTAYLAYAQSWKLINYMYTTFGQQKMAKLIMLMNGNNSEFNEDLTQAIGEDQLHLENQWRLYYNQPSVLTSTNTAPPVQKTTVSAQKVSGIDPTTTLLLAAGILLILLPVGGIAGYYVVQRRKQHRILQAQQVRPVIPTWYQTSNLPITNTSFDASQQSFQSYGDQALPYTDPYHYTSRPLSRSGDTQPELPALPKEYPGQHPQQPQTPPQLTAQE